MKISIQPLTSESMGTRSMCTYVETPDVKILVDPGVSLARRWGLLPHPQEYQELVEGRRRITHCAEKSDIITISHYHFDHCTPSFTDYVWNFSSLKASKQIFQDKLVLAKDIRTSITARQRRRGWMMKKMVGGSVKEYMIADGRSFSFGGTQLLFSKPVFHGEEGTYLGWVLMLCIDVEEERFMHASDIQGPMVTETLNMLLSAKPGLIYLSGPPLYLANFMVEPTTLEKGMKNLVTLTKVIPTLIVDHHLVRDTGWKSSFQEIFETAKAENHDVQTAAEFLKKKNRLLEANRRQLYERDPPSSEFLNWTNLPREKRRKIMPPL